ncbi:MAG: penicillin-binding protein 2 [Candidatus Marinimicrobia bacterium]|nr:penicillin-binding protein 2 [Candidatus Neomarinimicrobiota bacterium]MDP6593777.1 penicillin-binding protein 2 [Candidatus Neomarinimicrobiota bacterium]MDP6835657.1 penicillin-binding protein 2 [Candidatus Neomarinimicrobiota bacterium]MDP6966516.1 penicillin-binding protein 2 [Candidatus Neomarinimicrobiota bacterium]
MLKSEIYVTTGKRNVVYGVAAALFALLITKFFILQIYRYDKFFELSEYNRVRPITTYAPRGKVLDKYGNILVANRSVYTISIIRDEIVDKDRELKIVASYLEMNSAEVIENLNKYYRGRFLPARIARDVPIERLSLVEEHKNQLPGVIYSEFPVRYYPKLERVRASHLLGYLREIARSELDGPDYLPGDFIGAQGIEKEFESVLRGKKGTYFQQVDAYGRQVGTVKERPPIPAVPGEDIHLTVDGNLQGNIEYIMEGKIGSAIVLDAVKGQVLAMVSKPDYQLEDFAGFMEPEVWRKYTGDGNKPLFNRAVQGIYPPGSAMKLITTITALEEGLVNPGWTVSCSGTYHYGDRFYGCWKEEGHGVVNLSRAIVESCNIYFYQLVQRIKLDSWHRYAMMFGFGQKTGVEVTEEYGGTVPNTVFMDGKYGKRGWTKGHLLNIAIGQGDILVTPLQMAHFAALLAARGEIPKLTLIQAESESKIREIRDRLFLKQSTWSRIRRLMFDVVNSPDGTAYSPGFVASDVNFFGKTGSAQNPLGDLHAWFIGFAEKGDQKIALVVLVEHGGKGGTAAAPLAARIVREYFQDKKDQLTFR